MSKIEEVLNTQIAKVKAEKKEIGMIISNRSYHNIPFGAYAERYKDLASQQTCLEILRDKERSANGQNQSATA